MTDQQDAWDGPFGSAYTDRNPRSVADLDRLYIERFGVARTRMNREFLGGVDRGARVLEVGANVGVQLRTLDTLGFRTLLGIEYQEYAIRRAREIGGLPVFVRGSALELPVRTGCADLVFTSGLLIHIAPADLDSVIDEVWRASRRWVWGFEYYAPDLAAVPYRGREGLLWKADYAALFLRRHPDLALVKERRYRYLAGSLEDQMFLLKKRGGY